MSTRFMICIAAALLVIAASLYVLLPRPVPAAAPVPSAGQATSIPTSEETHSGMKLYHNDKFRFEFWYPEEWKIEEDNGGGPYIIFQVIAKKDSQENFPPLSVLVSTLDHANQVIDSIKNEGTSKQTQVGGISAVKYDYVEDTYHTDYVIIFHDHAVFIGNTNKEHVPEFNEIISSFKFLK